MRQRSAVFICDGRAAAGGGHMVRCLALARALAATGDWRMVFAPPANAGVIAAFGGGVAEIAAIGPGDGPFDLAVFDGYGFGAADEQSWRGAAARLVVIDDLADRRHDCDVLVDAGAERKPADYAALVPAGCRILTGPAFALLRPEFAGLRRRPPAVSEGRVLVSFGLSDSLDLTRLALTALASLPRQLSVDVVIGSASPNLASLRKDIESGVFAPLALRLHVDTADMARLTAGASLVIGAPGSSSWERAALGIPSVLVIVAENQAPNAAALAAAGAAHVLGRAPDIAAGALAAAVAGLLDDPSRRAAMAAAAAALCDGLGAARVAIAAAPERALDGMPVTLDPASRDDCRRVFDWQCDPATRRFARNPAAPIWEEHAAWFSGVLADPRRHLSIVSCGGEPAGVVRLDQLDADAGYEVSILTAPGHTRRGIAAAALRAARRLVPDVPIHAAVLPGNTASHALFTAAGYRRVGPEAYVSDPIAGRGTP